MYWQAPLQKCYEMLRRVTSMYIEKFWGNYIGGSDDSLNLLEYLAEMNLQMKTGGSEVNSGSLEML